MNKIQIAGISLFSLGLLLILGFLFYEFFLNETEISGTIKISLLLIFLGLIVLLGSLSFERLKELKK